MCSEVELCWKWCEDACLLAIRGKQWCRCVSVYQAEVTQLSIRLSGGFRGYIHLWRRPRGSAWRQIDLVTDKSLPRTPQIWKLAITSSDAFSTISKAPSRSQSLRVNCRPAPIMIDIFRSSVGATLVRAMGTDSSPGVTQSDKNSKDCARPRMLLLRPLAPPALRASPLTQLHLERAREVPEKPRVSSSTFCWSPMMTPTRTPWGLP